MSRKRVTEAAFAIAVAAICALAAGFWWLARTQDVDKAMVTGGGVFAFVATMAFLVLTYVRSG